MPPKLRDRYDDATTTWAGLDEAPAPKESRPEITHKGTEITGALRTKALVKSFEVNPCEDVTLIGLMILSLGARNVNIQTKDSTHATREKLV